MQITVNAHVVDVADGLVILDIPTVPVPERIEDWIDEHVPNFADEFCAILAKQALIFSMRTVRTAQ